MTIRPAESHGATLRPADLDAAIEEIVATANREARS